MCVRDVVQHGGMCSMLGGRVMDRDGGISISIGVWVGWLGDVGEERGSLCILIDRFLRRQSSPSSSSSFVESISSR